MIPGVEYHRSFGMAAESIAMPRQSGVYPISLPKSGIDVIIEADRKSQHLFRSELASNPVDGWSAFEKSENKIQEATSVEPNPLG